MGEIIQNCNEFQYLLARIVVQHNSNFPYTIHNIIKENLYIVSKYFVFFFFFLKKKCVSLFELMTSAL